MKKAIAIALQAIFFLSIILGIIYQNYQSSKSEVEQRKPEDTFSPIYFMFDYSITSVRYNEVTDLWVGTAMRCDGIGHCDSISFISIHKPNKSKKVILTHYTDPISGETNWYLLDYVDGEGTVSYGGWQQ